MPPPTTSSTSGGDAGLTALFFNAFPVQRTAGGIRSISAKSLLQRGIPLLVFPEGTRSKDGTIGHFKPGAAALASSCDVPCIPVALVGVHIAHPRGTNWPKRGRLPVGVVIGKPMRALRRREPGGVHGTRQSGDHSPA